MADQRPRPSPAPDLAPQVGDRPTAGPQGPPAAAGWRYRPRGVVRHLAGLLGPGAAMAGKVALEENAGLRWQRLSAAARDRVGQRLRPTRTRMRALTARQGGRFEWREVAVPPPPGPLEAIVHPIAVATCDLDRLLGLGATPFALPLHFGHECVAEVLSVGERVTGVRPGQRVVVPFQISCGECPPCRQGRTGNCASVPPISMYGFGVGGGHWGGVLSDQLLVPFADAMLVPLPDSVEPAAAASVADNVSDGYRHVAPYARDLLERDADAEVLIIAGLARRPVFSASVPLYAGLIARTLGLRNVRVVDSRSGVREHAAQLGLQPLRPSELRRHAPAPLVVDVSGSPRGLRAALGHTARDGVCSSAGGLHTSARIPTGVLYGRNVTYHVSRTHVRTLIPQVLDLMSEGRLHPERVTTHRAPLDDAPHAIKSHVLRGEATKTVLVE
jgi:alcohol dehydrogenase